MVAPANRRIGAFQWNIGWRRRVTSPPNCRAFLAQLVDADGPRPAAGTLARSPENFIVDGDWHVCADARRRDEPGPLLAPLVSASVLALMLGPWVTAFATPLLIAGTVTFSHVFPQHEIHLPE